ncbi:MAG TPA: hypothetical protein EYH20_07305 [Leucothrix sp.]|nr:hypothetical protein [Leucothrix sp.]
MTEKKAPSDPKQDELYTNHAEPFPQPKEGGALTMFFLFIWYLILGVAGIALLGFVALFVACMV